MKTWKWTALIVTGGMLLQFQTCVTDIAYYVIQLAAQQIITGALTAATT